jgi:2',3'-cyclic-nucleotide 2'-phosphodiesterase/3'-nucleotidase/5'-nucleotidase
MKIFFQFKCVLLFALLLGFQPKSEAQIRAQLLGRYSIGTYNSNGGVAEISAFDPGSKRMFVINGPDSSIKIVNIANPASPVLVSTISVKPYGIDVTSVACNKKGLFAIAVIDSNGKTNPSSIVFLDINGNFISKVKAGANADNLAFTSNGLKLLVANEGEPNVGYTIDPEGSVSIIDLSNGAVTLTQANVQTAGFTSFNAPAPLDSKIRVFGRIQTSGGAFLRNSTVAEDLEPEYITVSDDNTTAWVTCQENNCVAVLNINTATITSLMPLGFKNHNLPGNGLDPTDQPASAGIANYPVFGMYNPDGISSYKVGTQNYFVTANEGDARADWGTANNEEVRVNNAAYVLDTTKFGGATGVAAVKANSALGRLNVTNRYGDFNNDGKFDSIFVFGTRSFSIWNGSTGALVWDSKDEFEQRVLATFPANFNCGHTTNSLDDRSDNKGPEPESITIGKILDSTYAFVGLERVGGIMIYNITNPSNPYFVQYINTRDFNVTPNQANLSTVGDLGPEGIVFIPRNESPIGKDMILLSNEVSGTVSMYQIDSRSAFQLQVLHASDMESGIDAPIDAPNFAAVMDTLEGTYLNTVKLASGDCFIPSPFLAAGEDPSMQTPLRNTASFYYGGTQAIRAAIGRTDVAMMNIMGFQGSAFGNHEFDLGTPEVNSIIGVDIRSNGADKRWIGAQFPYLSANLNFANDINLSYLTTNQRLLVDSFKTSPTITANAQKKGIAPSAIIQLNGDRVGIVGATTQLLASISSPGATTVLGGSSDNMPALAAVLQPVIDSLRAMGINKIILMSHLQQLANEKALAPLLKGVDIIIAGGSHSLCADGNDRIRPGTPVADRYPILTLNNDNEPLAILNTTSEWKYVGRFVCDFDSLGRLLPTMLDSTINGAYAADTAMVTSLWGNYSAAFAAGTKGGAVRTLTTAIASVINSKDGNKFGKTNVFLEGRRNFVRTEETNFGDLSADANLWYARQYDNQVKVSIKNGGGIRSAIGNVNAVGSTTILEKTLANPSAGKASGDISQLDIENSLRFNNGLSIVRTNAAGLKRLLEHGISATVPGATPGQFPQVGGVAFSYDTTKVVGNRIQSLVIIDSLGNKIDTIAKEGKLFGDTTRTYKIVTLDFLANGGDNYPFPANTNFRVNLDTAIKVPGVATFTTIGKEQDAFAEYMATRFTANPYNVRDTSIRGDFRIQLLNARQEGLIVPNSGPSSSQSPYLLPVAPGVRTTAILTAGDKVGNYMMAGLADGTGAYDNGNGTFIFLVSHELGSTLGVNRAHGAKGAFVSKWVINKSDLSVVSGSDLIQKVNLWNGTGYTLYNPADTTSKKAFNRFCSSDLPAVSAFYNAATGLGTQERIFMNGEEAGNEGRAFGHILTGVNAGTTYELPYLGKFSWENSVASPVAQNKTIVVGTDDATPGQVYFYIGTKTNTGTEIEKAGLSNGRLYGVAVAGLATEISTSIPAANTAFTLVDLGIVRDSSGAALNSKSNALGVTNFLRPEDGHWDPSNPNDFYFVTTNSFTAPSRLWRLRMSDIKTPELGGTITAVLDGTEGPKMMDNMTIDNYGHVLIQEDPGNQSYLAKIWQYNIATDQVKLISTHDSTRFVVGGANYLTQDEESSGIIDMQSILGAGMFLMVDQAHYGVGGEQVEGGQILSLYNPDTYNANPEINVKANSVNIPNGLTTPNVNTQFGIAATGSSETKTFIVENTAIGSLTIKSIAITGINASEFSIVTPSITPANINGNSTLSVTVKFTPKVSGSRNATLVINNNDFDEPVYSFAIQGTGVCTSPIVSVTYVGSNSFCAGDSVVLNANNSSTFSYQWSKSGIAINGANASKYTAKETGNFTVMVTDTFACSANSSAVGVIANPIPAKPSISRSGDVLTSSLESNYQWYLNGGIINGATARNYTATTKGSYTVKVTNAAGCASVLSDSLSFIPTGLNLYQAINQVSIAPNPYTDFTNIQLGLNSNSFVRIEVVSTLGVLVEVLEEKQLSAGNHTYTFGAKEHGFAAGMYLVRISVDGETVVKRIVENK